MCLSHLIYTVRPCLIHTCHAAPMPSPTMAFFLRPRRAWPSREGLRANCPRSASAGYHAEFHEVIIRRIPISYAGCQSETKHRLSWTRERVVAAHYKKYLLPSSDISGYHADFREGHGTIGAGQGRGMACVN